MPTNYPGSLDSLPRPTSSTAMNATGYEGDVVIDNLSDAVEAVQAELGTDPAGAYPTLKTRLLDPLIFSTHASTRAFLVGPDYSTGTATSTTSLTSQRQMFARWHCPESFSATKLWWVQTTAAATVTTAAVGLYDSSGTLLQSADVSSVVTSTGLKSATITSQSLTAGSAYWFAYLVDATTAGAIAGCWGTFAAAVIAATGSSSSDRAFYSLNTQTSLPSSVTYSSLVTSAAAALWFGVSAA